jgi:serine/threonine protein kinase
MDMTWEEFSKRYQYDPLKDKIGAGGFGSVFKAYDNHLDIWVALKIAEALPGKENLRLRKEVEMISSLPAHPNVARYEACYTFRLPNGEHDFGILQYYEEGNFSQLLEKHPLSNKDIASILSQILSGIDFLHGQKEGIIHRDLKPQNILMAKRPNGEYVPKITDFGISKKLDGNKSAAFENSLMGGGTLSYASPEQLQEKNIKRNTDLWSFGVIAYRAFTGELPFTTGGHESTSEVGRLELFRQINVGELPNSINNVPEPWQGLIRRCLVKDSEQRINSASECLALLGGKQEPPAAQPSKNYCTKCGKELVGGSKFCHSCGAEAVTGTKPAPTPMVDDVRTTLSAPGETGALPSRPPTASDERTTFEKRCERCGKEVQGGGNLCSGCMDAEKPKSYCKKCGRAMPYVADVCANCSGAHMPPHGTSPQVPYGTNSYGSTMGGGNPQAINSVKPPGNGLATASLVLGILWCVAIIVIIIFAVALGIDRTDASDIGCSLVFSAPGFVMGILARKKLSAAGQPTSVATAGIILNIIPVALIILF